jgi:hypothetical protein
LIGIIVDVVFGILELPEVIPSVVRAEFVLMGVWFVSGVGVWCVSGVGLWLS